MSIFSTVSDRFFNPFCCRNRELYFACITELIERSKELPVLYEADARSALILYLQNCQYAIETEQLGDHGEVIGSTRSPQENASAILRYFRSCGWITPREVGRSGDNIASVSAYCRKLVDALHKIFDADTNSAITNHIFSIYEILRSSFEKDSARAIRPYSNILLPLIENECDLKNELLILKDSIREIMRAVMRMADANSFGHFLMKDELLNRFFSDYFFIKKSGLIPSYIADIDRLLYKLRCSDLYEKMVTEYVSLKHTEEKRARELIERQFDELDSFINLEYERDMSYIDRKINAYYNLYATRIAMVLGSGTNLENLLGQLLNRLKTAGSEERELILEEMARAHRLRKYEFVGRKSLERRKKRKDSTVSAGLLQREVSEQELLELTEAVLRAQPDRYSMDRVKAYFDEKRIPAKGAPIETLGICTREDGMMAAASIIYSGSAGFPYEVAFEDGMVETEAALISRIRICPKRSDQERGKQ